MYSDCDKRLLGIPRFSHIGCVAGSKLGFGADSETLDLEGLTLAGLGEEGR